MQDVDTLIHARWIIPVEPLDTVWEQRSIVVHQGRIRAVLPRAEAEAGYRARETVELPEHALCPGLVNAHTHAGMSLMRGLADDLPLMEWLQDHIWPAESRCVSPEFVADGVELAAAEMLRSGTTCFSDMYYFPDVIAHTAARLGLRACVGLILLDFPTPWAADADEYLHKGLAVHDRYRDHPLISTAFAPHAPYTVSDKPLQRLRVLAEELDRPVHMHVHETAGEIEDALRTTGERPLARLHRLGLVSPRLVAVHMTQLQPDEIRLCAESGISIVHCPESNLKLASGFCPVAELLDAGINVALGTDGAASNNDLNMLGEMRTAAMLAKAVSGKPGALPAHQALRMATLCGAQAIGLGEETGSLKAGKWADLCAVDLHALETEPVYNAASQIVYAAARHQVSDVWVAGRRVLKARRLTAIDESSVRARAREWGRRVIAG